MDTFSIDYYLKVNYKNKTNNELAKPLDIPVGAVKHRLSKLGLKRPSKYSYNDTFFSEWSEDMAYIFGFLVADGYMSSRHSYVVGMELSIKDINILTAMASKLGNIPLAITERNINDIKRRYCKFSLYSKKIYDDLIKLGLMENKSLTMGFPYVPSKYMSTFIRGVFDGDGCISVFKGGKDVFICCSHSFGRHLDLLLNSYGIETIKPRVSTILKVRLSTKKENICKFFDFLYSGCDESSLRLDRKYDKFLLCI